MRIACLLLIRPTTRRANKAGQGKGGHEEGRSDRLDYVQNGTGRFPVSSRLCSFHLLRTLYVTPGRLLPEDSFGNIILEETRKVAFSCG